MSYTGPRSSDPNVYMVDLLVDDDTAFATPEQFDRLMEYSGSLPTGMYQGKRWKRAVYRRDGEGYPKVVGWQLGEYFDLPDDDKNIGIRWRELLVVE
jgi:hypothetical protein